MLSTLLVIYAYKFSTLPSQSLWAKPTIVCGNTLLLAHHGEKEAHESPKEGGKGDVRVQIGHSEVQLGQKSSEP